MHIGSQLRSLDPVPARDRRAGRGRRLRRLRPRRRARASRTSTATRRSTPQEWVDGMVAAARAELGEDKSLVLEPGRALVANAGVTLYTRRVGQAGARGGDDRGGRRRDVRQSAADALRRRLLRRARRRAWAPTAASARWSASTASPATCWCATSGCPDPRPGDVLVTPVTGAYGHAMANNYNGVPRPPVIFCSGGDARAGRAARDLRGPAVPETFRIGLLGHGTVGSAFEALLAERADAFVPITGMRPEVTGVLTRSRGYVRRDPRRAAT